MGNTSKKLIYFQIQDDSKSKLNQLLQANMMSCYYDVLDKYIEIGVEELEQDKLPDLLKSKYQTLEDAKEVLGDVNDIIPHHSHCIVMRLLIDINIFENQQTKE
jgi:hypothetical protein